MCIKSLTHRTVQQFIVRPRIDLAAPAHVRFSDKIVPGDMDELERTIRTYDAVAETQIARTRDRSFLATELDRFRESLSEGAVVLDVGAGSGADSEELRLRGLRVVSCDLSFGMLKAGGRQFPGPRVQADMRRLPFIQSVEGCWVHASLLHLPRSQVPETLAEFRRVLVPPAMLHVAVKRGSDDELETGRYGVGYPRWFTYWEPEELDRVLADAGFRIVEGRIYPGLDHDWISRLCRADV